MAESHCWVSNIKISILLKKGGFSYVRCQSILETRRITRSHGSALFTIPLKRTWNLAPVHQIVQKISVNYCPCLYLSIGKVCWLNELWFKRYICNCTLSHVLILILTSQSWMVKNTKAWISWERNITFLQNKKNSQPVPQMTHSEKLSFCSGGNL